MVLPNGTVRLWAVKSGLFCDLAFEANASQVGGIKLIIRTENQQGP